MSEIKQIRKDVDDLKVIVDQLSSQAENIKKTQEAVEGAFTKVKEFQGQTKEFMGQGMETARNTKGQVVSANEKAGQLLSFLDNVPSIPAGFGDMKNKLGGFF